VAGEQRHLREARPCEPVHAARLHQARELADLGRVVRGAQPRQRRRQQRLSDLARAREGGVTERQLSPEEGGARKMDDEQLAALARLGDDLEKRLGGPQDIEWALEGGEIYVLQARPVTT
jgi:pyruvate,water dikinase